MARFCATLCLLAAMALAPAGAARAHGEAGVPEPPPTMAPRLESAGSDLELVAVPEHGKLILYLDRLATNEPVDGAVIEVSGAGLPAQVAKPAGTGTYEVAAPWAEEPGAKALVFTVAVDGTVDLLNGTLTIPAPAAEAEAGRPLAWTDLLARPEIWALAAGVALLGFILAFAFRPLRLPDEPAPTAEARKDAAPSAPAPLKRAGALILVAAFIGAGAPGEPRAHSDHDHGGDAGPQVAGNAPRRLPDGDVFLPKPSQRLLGVRTSVAAAETAHPGKELIGTVIPDPSSFGQVQAPMDGRIELSERGISYVGQRVAAGEVLAVLSPTVPVADLGTMQQLKAEVEGKLKISEQKLARLSRIAGVVAQREIDDTRAELEALREQKRVLTAKDGERIELVAPVSGIISLATVRAGQVVTTRETLFEIVDPARLWIEAIGTDPHGEDEVRGASAIDSEGHHLRLSYVGRAPALRHQALPLLFRVEERHEPLSIGSGVKVVLQGSRTAQGVVLPAAAVVRGANGLPRVWTKVSAERFRPLPVRVAPLDGARVLVLAGVEEGARVVVAGAELVEQVR